MRRSKEFLRVFGRQIPMASPSLYRSRNFLMARAGLAGVSGSRKPKTWQWILTRIRDGNGIKPPRNLIDLINKARDAQARREEREGRSWPAGSDLPIFSARCGSPSLSAECWDLPVPFHEVSSHAEGLRWTDWTNRGTAVTAFIAALSAPEGHSADLAEQLCETPGPQPGQVELKEEDCEKEPP
jgi:hypothetical protein